MGLRLFSRKSARPDEAAPNAKHNKLSPADYEPAGTVKFADDPFERTLQLERFGIAAQQRDVWRSQPSGEAAVRTAEQAIDERFALVPEGYVSMPRTVYDYPGSPEVDCETAPFLLAKHPVTNAQFQKFVDAGGYEDLDL